MRIPETWKRTFKSLSSYTYTRQSVTADPETVDVEVVQPTNTGDDVHSTPAGQYPREGPQPGKLGVIFYYFSVCLCIIGVLTMAKCTYIAVSSISVLKYSGRCVPLNSSHFGRLATLACQSCLSPYIT